MVEEMFNFCYFEDIRYVRSAVFHGLERCSLHNIICYTKNWTAVSVIAWTQT